MSVLPTENGERLYRAHPEPVEGPLDAIVIGSGMGGMSCAATLARLGKRVALLERHYLPGGYTHMFGRAGFRWDVGVHALGELRPGDLPANLLRWLGEGDVPMASLGDPYDVFRFPDGVEVEFPSTPDAFWSSLKGRWPEQVDALDRYLERVKEVVRGSHLFFFRKSLPAWLDRIVGRLSPRRATRGWTETVDEVLDACGIEGELRSVLTAQWGYHGAVPGEAAFAIQALIHAHFRHGAWYPVGGSRSIASALLGTIARHGGAVRTKAEVRELLVERGRAAGVVLADGTELRAPVVISAAGARTTATRLAPPALRDSDWARAIADVPDSPSYVCLNLGFEGDVAAAGAGTANLWLFGTWRTDQQDWDPTTGEDAHILYVSFPSLKDPEHDPGPRQRHTGECVTFVPWDLFARWRETRHRERSDDYEAFKEDLRRQLVEQLERAIPEVMRHCVFSEVSTPLTAQHFVGASRGAIYGLEATPKRFGCDALRTRTPLPGLLMTGVDVATAGVSAAMASGILTAAAVDKRAYLRFLPGDRWTAAGRRAERASPVATPV